MKMVTHLRFDEPVRLDREKLEHLYVQLGSRGAEDVISRAMEELAVRLAKVGKAWKRGDMDEVRRVSRSMVAISEQIGMVAFARVSGQVSALAVTDKGTALAATVTRLTRIGESSLIAVWDLQDLSV
jgi:hypothetical protein